MNRLRKFAILILILLGVVAYANTFNGALVFDDRLRIAEDMSIRDPWGSMQGTTRPLVGLTLWANYATGGDDQPVPPEYPDAIVRSSGDSVELKLPKWGRLYRLFAYVRDGRGGGAVANVPLKATGPEAPVEVRARKADLPLVVYDDKAGPYVPSGWMGDTGSMAVELDCAEEPHSGKACVKVSFNANKGWGGVVWQNPANDWGERPGGRDLTGATKLVMYARGGSGGEKVKFGYGILGRDKKFFDTASGELEVELSRRWREYVLYLDDKDLRRIKTGFYWSFASPGRPLLFYLDDIRYEAD